MEYFTAAKPGSDDVTVASAIAERFGLEYHFPDSSESIIAPQWPMLASRLVRQTDALVSVLQAHNLAYIAEEPHALAVHFWGIGGKACRAFYGVPFQQWTGTDDAEVLERVVCTDDGSALVRMGARESFGNYIRQFVREAHEEGFVSADLPDLFYTFDRVRRWAGSSARTWFPSRDVFAPFCTRPFLRASFQFDALHRATGPRREISGQIAITQGSTDRVQSRSRRPVRASL